MAYGVEFTDQARAHLRRLRARDRATVLAGIREQLVHEPARETRNRKRLRLNPVAPWALRIGHLRVYYGVSETPRPLVTVRAIGLKLRERVFVGKEEIDLS